MKKKSFFLLLVLLTTAFVVPLVFAVPVAPSILTVQVVDLDNNPAPLNLVFDCRAGDLNFQARMDTDNGSGDTYATCIVDGDDTETAEVEGAAVGTLIEMLYEGNVIAQSNWQEASTVVGSFVVTLYGGAPTLTPTPDVGSTPTPTPVATVTPSGTVPVVDFVAPAQRVVGLNDTISIPVSNVLGSGLYGSQVECVVSNPAVVELITHEFGDLFGVGGDSWVSPNNEADTQLVMRTRQAPQSDVNADGILVNFHMRTLSAGVAQFNCVVTLFDRFGVALVSSTLTHQLTVNDPPAGALSGVIDLTASMNDDSGGTVSVFGITLGSAVTDVDGNFSFIDLLAGRYDLRVDASGYLSECVDEVDFDTGWYNTPIRYSFVCG